MDMDRPQYDYLQRRLNEITEDKLTAKRTELFGEGGSETAITWGMVFAAIKSGEIELKEGQEKLTRPFLKPDDVNWPALQEKILELNTYRDQLAQQRKTLEDSVVLNDQAYQVLTKYANS